MSDPPSLLPEDTMSVVAARLPKRLAKIIEDLAKSNLRTRSDIIRTLLVAKLAETGHVSIDRHNFRL